jgi:hypothetical protein
MLVTLNKGEKEAFQRKGYMCEHLLCLYSMVSDQTFLYDNNFPVFLNGFGEADVVLFGLEKKQTIELDCIKNLNKLDIDTLNIISSNSYDDLPNVKTRSIDWDFHINVNQFDFNLKGSKHKNIRNRLRQANRMDYNIRLTREFSRKHTYILSRHLSRRKYDKWDYEELLSLERFFREHNHGFMMEVYKGRQLIGFDVVDFFEENKIMVVPLGIYLENTVISDFLMYENLKFARDNGYKWIDVGLSCGNSGLRRFKEKWSGIPKYKVHIQQMKITDF